MAANEINLLTVERGLVVAPAGCGKTQLIVEGLKRHAEDKPVLILTHTNAGVAALRSRLANEAVPSSKFRLSTIDGFAMRLAMTFPDTGRLPIAAMKKERLPYSQIQQAAVQILDGGRLSDILRATYARVLVDEYQDCGRTQHQIVCWLAKCLPTCVLGDTLQAIFDFNSGGLPDLETEVAAEFKLVGSLDTPWRWIRADREELGRWLLNARQALLSNGTVDLRDAPKDVTWVQLPGGSASRELQLNAARTKAVTQGGSVLVVADSKNKRWQKEIARQTHGTLIEAVDLSDLVDFSSSLDLASPTALNVVVRFGGDVMVGAGAEDLLRRVQILKGNRYQKEPTELELVALQFEKDRSIRSVVAVLVAMNEQSGVRVHRPDVLNAAIRALNQCLVDDMLSFREAAINARERNRAHGRHIPPRGVGSTLLVKGLEADTCVVVDGDSMNAKNLYVAITRGSHKLVVCSESPILPA